MARAGRADLPARREPDVPVVHVVYAEPDVQRVVRVAHVPGLTAEQAVRAAGLLEALRAIAAGGLVLGVFGVRVDGTRVLEPGDRVEICRPLRREPRERGREAAG